MSTYYLAVDIGASSGRLIIAWKEAGKLMLEEVYRFQNGMRQEGDRLCWDMEKLLSEIKAGLKECARLRKVPAYMGIGHMGSGFRIFAHLLRLRWHIRVFQERPDVNAVVHAHPMYATSFAIAGMGLTAKIMPEAVISLGEVPLTPYGTPSTMEIPDAISPYLQDYDSVLLANHGALSYAGTLLDAYHKMESVEFYARLLYQARMLGGAKEFSDEQVERLYEIRRQFGLPGKHPANKK